LILSAIAPRTREAGIISLGLFSDLQTWQIADLRSLLGIDPPSFLCALLKCQTYDVIGDADKTIISCQGGGC
jgi:hypothetical protein